MRIIGNPIPSPVPSLRHSPPISMSNSSHCNPKNGSVGQIKQSSNQSHSNASFQNQQCSSFPSDPSFNHATSSSGSTMSQGSSMSSARSLEQMNESRGRPYVSTMMARKHIRPPSAPPLSQRDVRILQGELYQQLIAKGATEEVAYERQRMFYCLNGIVNDL